MRVAWLPSILVVLLPPAARAEPAAPSISDLEARIARLERPDAPPLRVWGLLQADAIAWRQSSKDEVVPSTGEPLNDTRFLVRRAQLRATADYGLVSGAIGFEGNTVRGPIARILQAELTLGWPTALIGGQSAVPGTREPPIVSLSLGLLKIPFGLEVPELDERRFFLERATVATALFPGNYDLGARVAGAWRFLRYSIAYMNGEPIGERALPGRDLDRAKDLVGRIGVDASPIPELRIEAGFSGLTGSGLHRGSAPTKDGFQWHDTNENGIVEPDELTAVAGQPGTPSQGFDRSALGGDVRLTAQVPALGAAVVQAELVWATNLDRALVVADPVASARDLRERGFSVGASQELGPYAQVGVRYDRYDPDADATDPRGGVPVPKDSTYSTLAVTAAARLPTASPSARGARLVVEYDRNRNALGRAPSGAPTSLADDALTFRAQVEF